MENHVIRPYSPEKDRDILSELMFKFILESEYDGNVPGYLASDIHHDILSTMDDLDKGRNIWCSVCDLSSSPVGFVTYQRYGNAADEIRKKGVVEIESYVMPGYRCQGIGTLLKKEAIVQSRNLKQDGYPDISRLISSVRTDNLPNIKILQRLGFRKGREYEGCNGSTYRYYLKNL